MEHFKNKSLFDTPIYMTCGALLGSSAVGILARFAELPDTEVTRITGIAIGAFSILVLRIKKVF